MNSEVKIIFRHTCDDFILDQIKLIFSLLDQKDHKGYPVQQVLKAQKDNAGELGHAVNVAHLV